MRLFIALLFIFGFQFSVSAQIFHTPAALVPYLETAPEIISQAAVLIDAHTGVILYSKNPDENIPPASLTKLMTMNLVMKEIKEGRASYDEIIPITVESWAQSQPYRSSLMFLEPGQTVTLREILLGLAVVSGNDAAVAAALRLAPTMDDFAAMMTAEARRMGLSVTRFAEASGISAQNRTTAAEFASFCRQYLAKHPDSLKDFHSVQEFSYPLAANEQERYRNNPRTIPQENRNTLLKTFPGADGLKTGFINESGYNVALSAQRDETRFILVLLGAPNTRRGARIRDEDGARLLTWAFDNFKTVRPLIGSLENARLWKGKLKFAELELAEPADFTSHISRTGSLKYETIIPNPLIAPLAKGEPVGYLKISDAYGELSRTPLVTKTAYEKGNILKRIWHSIRLLFKR
ncbi:MAG: D-alanyl-D-alanine carboxypeptidase [Treponema sp.]|nr:D-alanyl-D-alanine carboxypeptidase [Treponema sp.]